MDVNNCLVILTALFVVSAAVDQEEIAGTNVTLECRLTGTVTFPTWKGPPDSTVYLQEGEETNANFTWVAYGVNNVSLVITDVQPEHSGYYTCEKDGNAAETISLNVLARPVVLLENKVSVVYGSFARSNVITGVEDKNVTVTCTASGANPRPRLDIVMPEDTTIGDFETRVTSVGNTYTARMSGKFLARRNYDMKVITCKANNTVPSNKLGAYTVEDTATVYLKLKPILTTVTRSLYAIIGQNITEKCDASLGRPAPTISWLFDGQPISTERFVVGPTAEVPDQATETIAVFRNVTLVGVRREDNGKILACSVDHEALDAPSFPSPYQIALDFGPDYVNITGNNRTFAGDDATLTLTCTTASMGNVPENPPSNSIIHWRNATSNEAIENNSDLTLSDGEYNGTIVSQDLTVNVTRYMDGQSITCIVVQQDDKVVNTSVTLDIDYPPIIIDPEDDVVRFAVGDAAALKCSAKSKPAANFSWYNESNVLQAEGAPGVGERNEFSLRWANIGHGDAGKYKCVATNGHDGYSDEKVVEVVITVSPILPSQLVFITSGTDSLTVSYSPPSREPDIYQSYYLQYRGATSNDSISWHEVSLPDGVVDFKLNDLKHGTEFNLRIKVVNKYGSTRYTNTQNFKTQDVALEDGITRKDLDIAIAVSVVVTAAVIIIIVAIIYVLRRKRMCGSSSEKFELQDR